MSRAYDRPITIQTIGGEDNETWVDLYSLHANINKAKDNDEYLSGGSIQEKVSLVFEVRYFENLENIAYNTSMYRIVYDGHNFNIVNYDDYMLQHKTVKLLGVSY